MIRKAHIFTLYPGCEAEYIKRHNPIWPELARTLSEHGARNYSIFLHRCSRQLFAYVEIESEARWAAVAQTEICQKWWAEMKDLMESNEDHSPVARPLTEVFHQD
ncbi:MAG: L-rhamnose mutarotase [Opitutales bacterium]